MGTVLTILRIPAVTGLIKKLTGKLLGNKNGVNAKVQVAVSPALLLALIQVVKQFEPGLGEILAAHEVAILGTYSFVTALVAYYLPEPV